MLRAVWVTLFVLAAAELHAADEPEDPDRDLPRGQTIWGVGGSAGIADGDYAAGFGSALVRMDRVLSERRGPGWLEGQLGYSVELVPLLVLSQGESTYAGGFNLLGRHYLGRGRSLRPFITLGAGLLVSSSEIPEGVAKVNFTPQLGFGIWFSSGGRALYSAELRLHHLSNGGRVHPNPGINSVVIQLGMSFPDW